MTNETIYLCGLRIALSMLSDEDLERFRRVWYKEVFVDKSVPSLDPVLAGLVEVGKEVDDD